jgi:Ser-tRNA(Ala) deacylase AlaX
MDKEGFSGCDGRTTIFDYWSPDTLCRLKSPRSAELTAEEKRLRQIYHRILLTANSEKALAEGDFFDLMYVNPSSWCFNPDKQYAFLRKKDDELLLVVVNFSDSDVTVGVRIPSHAFSFFNMAEEETIKTRNLWDNSTAELALKSDVPVKVSVGAYSGSIYKFNVKQQQVMNEVDYELNDHNKEEFPPAHTAEHLLNQLMVRMFGCERSRNAHIERKKSKISYVLTRKPDRKEEKEIERRMNELIAEDLPVTYEFVKRDEIPEGISLDKLPDDASETIRLVRIGDYDVCPCIGRHVRSTGQIGRFEMLGTNWDENSRTFRLRFKIV